jgi:hypothetical protein
MSTTTKPNARAQYLPLTLGRTVATRGALAAAHNQRSYLADLLTRHSLGDWGDLDPEDRQANEDALVTGDRILSSYMLGDARIWIITEGRREDRVTTMMLPDEY